MAKDYIKQIRIAGRSLLAIINDILDFSKIKIRNHVQKSRKAVKRSLFPDRQVFRCRNILLLIHADLNCHFPYFIVIRLLCNINEVIYEPMSMIYDVANIIMTRLKDKDVELILDVAPNLPNKLWGASD